jgi:lipopolysaccharide transport system permease protein
VLIIEKGRADRHYWRDLWQYRELFGILAWRDVTVRYKQTLIGIAWALIRPLLTMAVFTIVFGRIARLPSEGAAPYALMVFAGMLPWYLFASSVASASESVLSNANLITKVYFPRIVIPMATVVTACVDFAISLLVLAGLMAWYGFAPTWRLALLPFFMLLAVVASVGVGLLFAALNVKFRDFRHIVPFALQIGLYISPVGFASSVVPGAWRALFSLNPMVGVIDGFRWCVLGGNAHFDMASFAISQGVALALLVCGIHLFRATEKSFADLF